MTNIMAAVNNEPATEESQGMLFDNSCFMRVGIAMADSLGSNGEEVTRGNQKLFQAGKSFIMGTGAQDFILETVKSLGEPAKESPGKAAAEILDFTNKFARFPPGEMLNFIVAGYAGERLEVYHVAANRIAKPVLVETGFSADGSGAKFVGKALERDFQRGMAVNKGYLTLADLAVSFFDLGHAATKSAAVDDLLQFGFFYDGKAVALIHPFVEVIIPPESYAGNDGKYDSRKREQNDQFYFSFSPKMYESWQLQRRYNQISSAVRDGVIKDRQKAFAELEQIAAELSSKRKELNSMISTYCTQMHCEKK